MFVLLAEPYFQTGQPAFSVAPFLIHHESLSQRLAIISGTLGPLVVFLLTVIGGANFPHYSHASQFISELGSTDAPHGRLISWAGFLPAGLFTSAFAFFAWRSLPRSAAATSGMMGLFLFALGYLFAAFSRAKGIAAQRIRASRRQFIIFSAWLAI